MAAQAYAAGVLTGAGFSVTSEPFEYSALPGRLATPLIGAGLVGAISAAGHVGARGQGMAALLILLVAAVLAAVAARWLARDGVLDLPLMRAAAANLVAVRPGPVPRVWLMAHTDSKSQPVPQALRAAGIVGLALTWGAAAGLAALQAAGRVNPGFPPWIALALAGVVLGAPVVLSVVGNRSHGALDNASGVAAVLLAAEQLPPDAAVGVLITSAEELGLAGARAWARANPAAGGQIALNCDGVDDVGKLTAMFTGERPARVLEALAAGAQEAGHELRVTRLVPGILVDAVALADRRWQAVTLSRGTLATLARVHTARDTLVHLGGHGIPGAAAVLAAAARRLASEGDR